MSRFSSSCTAFSPDRSPLDRFCSSATASPSKHITLRTLCTTALPSNYISLSYPNASTSNRHVCQSSTGKGFGKGSTVKPALPLKRKPLTEELKKQMSSAEGLEEAQGACPCGGGVEKKAYKDCCARYHGGVKEPDAVTLLRARYCAYAKGIIPYIVRTTHSLNFDMEEGPEQLTADCAETCRRVVFKRMDILEESSGSSEGCSEEHPEEECFIVFRAVYAFKHGTTADNQLLVEKSRFVRESDRWWYREKVGIDAASDALWRHGAMLSEQSRPGSSITTKQSVYGRAQPKIRPRSG